MNKREENLIRILYERKNNFVLIKEMAKEENCCDKTVRNSLDRVEEYLNKFSCGLKLERKKGKGICLRIKPHSKVTLKDILGNNYMKEDTISDDERRAELSYTLLMSTKAVTLEEFSKKYYVNKKIITEDLKKIGRQLEKYNLKIISKQRIGNFIKGLEKDKRKALFNTIKDLNQFSKSKSTLRDIFLPHEIDIVKNEIMDLQRNIRISFTDESNNALVIHILFMIKRIKLNQPISFFKDEKDLVKSKIQYSWAVKLTKNLGNIFSITFSEDEIIYLTIHLLGMKYNEDSNIDISNFIIKSESNIVDLLINRLLDGLEGIGEASFKTDEILKQALRLHLYGSINRINYGLSLENPILDEIKRMNPYLYYEVLDVVDKFNVDYNIQIPREEVGYITIHFQASIERSKKNLEKKYSAVILCHMGVGISNYLKIKLGKIFPWVEFIGSISVKEVPKFLQNNHVDFIFSTVDIDDSYFNYIKINSIIDKKEESKIKESVNNNLLHKELKKDRKSHKYIYEKFIFLRKSFKNKFEVIKFITDKLRESNRIDAEFHSSVLKRESIDSTEIGNFLAIPHGDSKHIISSTISILTLKEPIIWGKEQVQIVFLLSVKKEDYSKDNTMGGFFKHLNDLSNNKEDLKKLIEEDNINNFFKLIEL